MVPVVLAGPPPKVMGSQSGSTSGGSSSSVVVLESSMGADGMRQEVLRSLCQVINTTSFALEVRGVRDVGQTWRGWTSATGRFMDIGVPIL